MANIVVYKNSDFAFTKSRFKTLFSAESLTKGRSRERDGEEGKSAEWEENERQKSLEKER